jgi:hypothetical protein
MSPLDAFVARANIVRMRLQLETSPDVTTQATLQQLLEEQVETLLAGEAEDDSKPGCLQSPLPVDLGDATQPVSPYGPSTGDHAARVALAVRRQQTWPKTSRTTSFNFR